mgnify:CR=1 FL=1
MNIIPNLPILHSKKTVGKFVFTQNYLQSLDLVVSKNIFAPNGADIVSAVEAKVVVTDTTAYDLEL